MNLNSDNILLIGSILLVISIIAGKTSYRFGVPVRNCLIRNPVNEEEE